MKKDKIPKNKNTSKKLSLYPLNFNEALGTILKAPPKTASKEKKLPRKKT